jgi:hypothetical protein
MSVLAVSTTASGMVLAASLLKYLWISRTKLSLGDRRNVSFD